MFKSFKQLFTPIGVEHSTSTESRRDDDEDEDEQSEISATMTFFCLNAHRSRCFAGIWLSRAAAAGKGGIPSGEKLTSSLVGWTNLISLRINEACSLPFLQLISTLCAAVDGDEAHFDGNIYLLRLIEANLLDGNLPSFLIWFFWKRSHTSTAAEATIRLIWRDELSLFHAKASGRVGGMETHRKPKAENWRWCLQFAYKFAAKHFSNLCKCRGEAIAIYRTKAVKNLNFHQREAPWSAKSEHFGKSFRVGRRFERRV